MGYSIYRYGYIIIYNIQDLFCCFMAFQTADLFQVLHYIPLNCVQLHLQSDHFLIYVNLLEHMNKAKLFNSNFSRVFQMYPLCRWPKVILFFLCSGEHKKEGFWFSDRWILPVIAGLLPFFFDKNQHFSYVKIFLTSFSLLMPLTPRLSPMCSSKHVMIPPL